MSDEETLRALQQIALLEKLGPDNSIWIFDAERGLYYQEQADRNDPTKCFTREQVDEMLGLLDSEVSYEIPDNGRD
ncbi:MAG: hypothetical protein WKF87_17845 [Chryseolinea sp.]